MAELGKTTPAADSVRLRPIEERDLPVLASFSSDPDSAGTFQWFGYRPMAALDAERRWKQDGLIADDTGRLVVDVGGDCAGDVDWRPVGKTGTIEIGVWLPPAHRGHGVGTEAQRQLVEYLFATSPVHRLQAGTEAGNIAEQRALEWTHR